MSKIEEFTNHFKHQLAVFIISALGFVVALNWQDTIKSTIDAYFPSGSGLAYKLLASAVLTTVAVPMIYLLSKLKTREVQLVEVLKKNE